MKLYIEFIAIALLVGVIGCGGKPSVGGPDQIDAGQVTNLVTGLTDAAQDPANFAKLFVTKPDAATLEKYKDYLYFQGAKPVISGTTAKVKVKLEKPAGTVAGEHEWEFEKVGEAWKLRTAPLP